MMSVFTFTTTMEGFHPMFEQDVRVGGRVFWDAWSSSTPRTSLRLKFSLSKTRQSPVSGTVNGTGAMVNSNPATPGRSRGRWTCVVRISTFRSRSGSMR